MNKILAVALSATLSLLSIGCTTTQPISQTIPEPIAPMPSQLKRILCIIGCNLPTLVKC